MLRSWVLPLFVVAAALLLGAAPPKAAEPPRIVAVGDLHGDHDVWIAIARSAGLIDQKGKWRGGNTTFVQLGDVVDRGPDSLKIIRDLMRLQREAPRSGGKVYVLVGNHEAMNMTDDLRYVHPHDFAAFADRDSSMRRDAVYEANKKAIETAYKARFPAMTPEAIRAEWIKATPLGKVEHQAAWSPDGEIGRWVIHNPAVLKLGGTLFVHGGISAAYAGLSIDQINRRVAEALKAKNEAPTSIINDPRGPLWYRGLITRQGDDDTTTPQAAGMAAPLTIDEEIDLDLRSFGVKRIVVGHTPSLSGILSASGGRLWRADSANSRAYGGTPSYLEIVGDRVTVHTVARPAGTPWGEP
jgi:hypothetical protein